MLLVFAVLGRRPGMCGRLMHKCTIHDMVLEAQVRRDSDDYGSGQVTEQGLMIVIASTKSGTGSILDQGGRGDGS